VIYIEFIERDRFMPIEIFRHLGRQSADWADGAADKLVLQIGRTLRLGPMPSYLVFWEINDIGRLDEWEAYFESTQALTNRRSQAMHRAMHIQRAGLYDTLFASKSTSYPLYYLEFYREFDAGRQDELPPGFTREGLVFVLRRVGWLGPAAEAISVWGCNSYQGVQTLSRRSIEGAVPIDAGVYKDMGTETL
jgi:hypothetical protein